MPIWSLRSRDRDSRAICLEATVEGIAGGVGEEGRAGRLRVAQGMKGQSWGGASLGGSEELPVGYGHRTGRRGCSSTGPS